MEIKDDLRDYRQEILDYLYEYGQRCGDNCGKYDVEIKMDLKMEAVDVKNTLNELYMEKKIVVRDGAQGKLIFLNYENYEVPTLQD